MQIQDFSEHDIQALKKQIEKAKKAPSGCLIALLCCLLIILFPLYLFLQETLIIYFAGVVIVFGIIAIYTFQQHKRLLEKDLAEGKKYAGSCHVLEKNKVLKMKTRDNRYALIFRLPEVGRVNVFKEFWESVNEGDCFYIERAIHSRYFFRFELEGEDQQDQIQVFDRRQKS